MAVEIDAKALEAAWTEFNQWAPDARGRKALAAAITNYLTALRPSPSSDERVDLRDSVIEDDADALKTWLWAEIGRLMHQAEHWANNGRPHAVLYRLHKADAYYQIIALCDRGNPFKAMRTEVARQAQDVPGAYPPSADLARYRDADFVASQAAAIRALQPHKGE
jgi:hypothetical protein